MDYLITRQGNVDRERERDQRHTYIYIYRETYSEEREVYILLHGHGNYVLKCQTERDFLTSLCHLYL